MEREQNASRVTFLPKEKMAAQNSNKRRISHLGPSQGRHAPLTERDAKSKKRFVAVWHAGDWTGPRSLQPEKRFSGESALGKTHDIVAMSSEGVKVSFDKQTMCASLVHCFTPKKSRVIEYFAKIEGYHNRVCQSSCHSSKWIVPL